MKKLLIVEENSEKLKDRFNLMLDLLDTRVDKSWIGSDSAYIETPNYKVKFVLHGKNIIGYRCMEVMYFAEKDDYYYECILPCLKVI
jgi:hypothetical protein